MRTCISTLALCILVAASGCSGTSQALPAFQAAPGTTAIGSSASGYQLLYTFQDASDGAHPGTVIAAGGSFYGTAAGGNKKFCSTSGCGVLYEITQNGTETPLVQFPIDAQAEQPGDGVAFLSGHLYGTAYSFKKDVAAFGFSRHGEPRVVSRLSPEAQNGLLAVNGTLYGTTRNGGTYGRGSVYALTPAGTISTVYSFRGGDDTASPDGYLMDRNGTLYGTASGAGQVQMLSRVRTHDFGTGARRLSLCKWFHARRSNAATRNRLQRRAVRLDD